MGRRFTELVSVTVKGRLHTPLDALLTILCQEALEVVFKGTSFERLLAQLLEVDLDESSKKTLYQLFAPSGMIFEL